MANSSIITALKKRVIQAIVDDDAFFYSIDPNPESMDKEGTLIENPSDLIGRHIFDFAKNPETITETVTFLTITADTTYYDRNKIYVTPILTIRVFSHNQHMSFTDKQSEILGFKQRITDNRNDYISHLLDIKFNGIAEGIGTLKLVSNTEGNAGRAFLYRQLVFETVDLNNLMCGIDE